MVPTSAVQLLASLSLFLQCRPGAGPHWWLLIDAYNSRSANSVVLDPFLSTRPDLYDKQDTTDVVVVVVVTSEVRFRDSFFFFLPAPHGLLSLRRAFILKSMQPSKGDHVESHHQPAPASLETWTCWMKILPLSQSFGQWPLWDN